MSAENLSITVGQIEGLDTVIRELNDLEPGLVKQLRKDLVTEVKPLIAIVKRKVESSKPFLSGFEHSGRTGLRGNPIKVTARTSTRKRAGKTSLVSIRTSSEAATIADMAGRKTGRGKTPQGQALIANLTARSGKPSRYIYPSIENEIPRIQQSTLKIVEEYAKKVNRRLLVTKSES
jgi:hypothetical protein